MDIETINYLITHYWYLLPGKKQLALKHVLHSEKVAAIADAASRAKMRTVLLRCGWLSDDAEVLALLQDGVTAFREQLAHRIYKDNGGDALLNTCSVCNRLARTPTARQCRHCGNDWHENQVGRIQ